MLTTLLKIASSSAPSSLATQLLEEKAPLANNVDTILGSSPSLLFIGETRIGEETFAEIVRLMPFLIAGLSLSGQLDCQLLRAFLGMHFPILRKERLTFIEYSTFKSWFTANQAALDPKLTTPQPLKHNQKKKIQLPPTTLETACGDRDLCATLYSELCLLAPHRQYKSKNSIHITRAESNFDINLHSSLKKQIEKILACYRHWMIKEKKLDLAVSDLSELHAAWDTIPSHKHYDHIVWNSRQKISPNIKNILTEMTGDIIDLSPVGQHETTNSTLTHTTSTNSLTNLGSDSETSTINDATHWADLAQELIDNLLSSNDGTLDEGEEQLLTQPEIIDSMLSSERGKNALRKILSAEPLLAKTIFNNPTLSMETLVSFILFITDISPGSAPTSLHFIIMQKTMNTFSDMINLYLKINKNSKEAASIREAIARIALENYSPLESTLALLCKPDNHKIFLSLLRLRSAKGQELQDYWRIIGAGLKKITLGDNKTSLLYHLLETIEGVAVLNQFIHANPDTSITIKDWLSKNSAPLLSKTFSAREVKLPPPAKPIQISPFIDLLNASIFAEIAHYLSRALTESEEEKILITTIIFLNKNSHINNPWSDYMCRIYSSIIISLAQYMQSFPINHWGYIEVEFPWEDLVLLIEYCNNHLKDEHSRRAADTLFKIVQRHSMERLLDEEKLTDLHNNVHALNGYGKKFFETSIEYLLTKSITYIQEFVNLVIHPNRYLVFTSLLKYADIKNSDEEIFVVNALNALGNNINQTNFATDIARNTNMYQNILSTLSNVQTIINRQKPNSTIRKTIFDLAIFFIEKLHKALHDDCILLYALALNIALTTQVPEEVEKIYNLFVNIHTQVLRNSISPKYHNTILNLYSSFLEMLLEIAEFPHRYQAGINIYWMAKDYYVKSPGSRNNDHSNWHSTMHLYAWMMHASAVAMAGRRQQTLPDDFFTEIFKYSDQNAIDNTWNNNQKNKILDVYISFFTNSIQYLLDMHQEILPPFICWEKFALLFDKETFDYSTTSRRIIKKVMIIMGLFASDVGTSLNIESMLSDISALRNELDDPKDNVNHIPIGQHPNSLFHAQSVGEDNLKQIVTCST